MSFFKLIDLTDFYFTPQQYADISYQLVDLYNAGYSVSQLYESGYTVQQISDLQINNIKVFTSIDLLNSVIPVINSTNVSNGLNQIMNLQTYPLAPIIAYYTNPVNLITTTLNHAIQKVFQIYNIVDLFNEGFSLEYMVQQNIPIATVYPLVNGDFNSYRIPQPTVFLLSLKIAGYTLLQLYSLRTYPNSSIPITLEIIYELGFTIRDFYNSGITAAQLAASGIQVVNPATLLAAGYTFQQVYSAGYLAQDYINAGITENQLIQAGLSVAQINSLGFPTVTLNELVTKFGASLQQLLDASFTLQEVSPYRINYYSISQYLAAGFTIQDLKQVGGFTPVDFYTGNVQNGIPTIQQILNLGYDVSDLIPLDISVSDYYDASYSSLNLFNNGFALSVLAANSLLNLAGYSLANFKKDGIPIFNIYESFLFNITQFINIGYQIADFYNGNIPVSFTVQGFSLQQVINIGYNINQIAATRYYPAAHFFLLNYPVSLLSPYYSIEELLAGGYSKRDLNIDGTKIQLYCCSKNGVLYAKPTLLGSSSNKTGISKKVAYSQSINNRIGGSYSTTFENYLTNPQNPTTPVVCANQNISTNISSGISSAKTCQAFAISSKTTTTFSYFIRNFIITQANLYLNQPSTIDIINIINEIAVKKINYPNATIYSLIQNYFNPNIPIISGPF